MAIPGLVPATLAGPLEVSTPATAARVTPAGLPLLGSINEPDGWSGSGSESGVVTTTASPHPLVSSGCTHWALRSGPVSGWAFTLGQHARAVGTIMCPARGVCSVWRAGTVPSLQQASVVPWVLVRGEGCHVLRTWVGAEVLTADDPAGVSSDGASGGGIGLDRDSDKGPCAGPVSSSLSLLTDAAAAAAADGLRVFGMSAPGCAWTPFPVAAEGTDPQNTLGFLNAWVDTLGRCFGMPQGIVAICVLGALGAALCSKARVAMCIDQPDAAVEGGYAVAWREQTVAIYFAGVAPSGSLKTPLHEAVMAPWRARQRELSLAYRGLHAAWKARVAVAHAELEAHTGGTAEELAEYMLASEEPPPQTPTLEISSATGPALAREMAYQPSVLLSSSEATEIFESLINNAGRMMLEPLLKGYSGESGGGVLRIGRMQPPAGPQRAAVVVLTQPHGLYGLGKHASVMDQGFFARILWASCDADGTPSGAIPSAMEQAWSTLVSSLLARQGPVRDSWGVETGDQWTVHASPAQTARLLAFRDRMTNRCRPGGDLYGLGTWVRKLHGQCARIAGLLTFVCGLNGAMDDALLDWALRTCEDFLLAHARHAWALTMWPANTENAAHIYALACIRRATPAGTRIETLNSTAHGASAHGSEQSGRSTYAITEVDKWCHGWPQTMIDAAIDTLEARGFATVSGPNRGPRASLTVSFL